MKNWFKWANVLVFSLCLIACSLFNFAGTNEDGTPKQINDGQQALIVLKSFADASLIVWGMPAMEKYSPELIPLVDVNSDSRVTVDEVISRLSSDRENVRSVVDFALRTWASEEIKKRYPSVVPLFDRNEDQVISLVEIEALVNLSDAEGLTTLITAALVIAANK